MLYLIINAKVNRGILVVCGAIGNRDENITLGRIIGVRNLFVIAYLGRAAEYRT